jgi:hypothetical protein
MMMVAGRRSGALHVIGMGPTSGPSGLRYQYSQSHSISVPCSKCKLHHARVCHCFEKYLCCWIRTHTGTVSNLFKFGTTCYY